MGCFGRTIGEFHGELLRKKKQQDSPMNLKVEDFCALEGGWVGFAKENICLAQEDMKMGGIIPSVTPVMVSLSRIVDGSWTTRFGNIND